MRIFRHYTDLPADARATVAAFGNFDGVHLGHRAVIEAAKRRAAELDRPLAVLTLEPHPRAYFQPDKAPFRLTPFRAKARLLEELGVEQLFVLAFDRSLAALSAEDFITRVLVEGMDIRHAVVGYDFAFGHKRRGDVELLGRVGAHLGFGTESVGPIMAEDGVVYSSSRIRDHLVKGEPRQAAALLGREWEIEGHVDTGRRLGNTIGFPTANLALEEYLRPAYGVYAVRCGVEGGGATRWFDGAANFGKRPTVDGHTELLEAHLFDFTGDLYGRSLRVAFVERLRAEKKFDGLDALKAQIAEDCRAARALLAERPRGAVTDRA
ncbi:MAG: bifunctional riboflavin kinase/FAD synthetase [Alphaproteobacteria bacterium]|nr:bifunctional riboflavin kinase/FAD synthetase [Alphaproteobacteria bacterium]